MALQVGDTIWLFDINKRNYVYPDGTKSSGHIWRDHWRPVEIKGETSRSWITNYGKAPKKGSSNWCFSEAELDDAVYVHDNAYKIGQKVRAIKDFDLLKRVAEVIGYDE